MIKHNFRILHTFCTIAFSLLLLSSFSFAQTRNVSVANDLKSEYNLQVTSNNQGKQFVKLLSSSNNGIYNLSEEFSEFTNLKEFSLLNNGSTRFLYFTASDLRYEVSYYWVFSTNKLYYVAKDFRDNKSFRSESLRKLGNSSTAKFISAHNANPSKAVVKSPPVEKRETVQEVIKEEEPETPRSWGSTTTQTKNESSRTGDISSKEGEQIVDIRNNNEDKYRAIVEEKLDGKKAIKFGGRDDNYEYKLARLPQDFSPSTNLSEFELLSSEKESIFHFSAADFDWLVDYYWDIKRRRLHYIAKGNQSGKIIRSDGLKAYNTLTRYVNNHYNGISTGVASNGTSGTSNGGTNGSNGHSTNGHSTNGHSNSGSYVPARNLALEIGDYLRRSRIFSLTLENSADELMTLESPKLVLMIKASNGTRIEHEVYQFDNMEMESFGFQTLMDNFVTQGANGQYLIFKNFDENITFLPPLKNGRYNIQAVLYSGNVVVRSNAVNITIPLP